MEYRRITLNEAGTIVSGATPKTSDASNFGGDIPWITPADLSGYTKKYIAKGARNISQKGYESCSTVLMPAGSVLFSSRAPIGYVAIARNPICTNQGFKSIIPNSDIDSEFLYYQLKYLRKQIQELGSGTTFKEISAKKFGTVNIIVPPLPEQERIVARIEELFSELDKAVETLNTTKQQLAVYRQAVLKEAFIGALTHSWRNQHFSKTADEVLQDIYSKNNVVGHTDLMENYSLPLLPKSWKWISIGDISKGAEYGSSKKSDKQGKVPVLRMGNIQNGAFQWDDLVYSSDEDEIKKYELHSGDVLFNRTNSPELVGKTAIYKGTSKAIFAGYLIRVNQVDEINGDYLTYYLNSSIARGYGNKVKTDGVNQSNINSKKLYSYPFPLCSSEEQKHIVIELEARLTVCDQIEKTIEQSLQQAEALRQSILKQAFEGRL